MNKSIIIYVLMLASINSLKTFNGLLSIWNLQGFGTDMNITYSKEITITNEKDIHASLSSNVLLTFVNVNIKLTKNIIINNLTNIIILGPVTLLQYGLYIQNSSNIIVRNIRILNSSIYGIQIYNSKNVVIDHCTILDASRTDITRGKCIDLTQQSSNVTLSYNIMGYTYDIAELHKFKGLLIANFFLKPVSQISIHHNIFYCNYQRSPQISSEGLFDMKQNIVFNFTEYGSRIRQKAYGNFMYNTYIGGKKDPLVFQADTTNVFSIENTWKFDGKQDRKIENIINHEQFITPTITLASKYETLQKAGCLNKTIWQLMVQKQISIFLK